MMSFMFLAIALFPLFPGPVSQPSKVRVELVIGPADQLHVGVQRQEFGLELIS
jgi:hypothetical protein